LVVTKRVFAQILSAQAACETEMERVDEIQQKLTGCIQICRTGRFGLGQASQEFTASSLGILSAYRRRQQAKKLLNDLSIIRTLVSVLFNYELIVT
jgi:ribosomal protein S18 acetylase RimI-like enzyme